MTRLADDQSRLNQRARRARAQGPEPQGAPKHQPMRYFFSSKLKIVKNHLSSCMLQPRLTSLSLMSIESDLLEDIDFSDIVRSFAENKSRKKYF